MNRLQFIATLFCIPVGANELFKKKEADVSITWKSYEFGFDGIDQHFDPIYWVDNFTNKKRYEAKVSCDQIYFKDKLGKIRTTSSTLELDKEISILINRESTS